MTLLFYMWEDPDLPSISFNVRFDFHILYFEKEKKSDFYPFKKNTGISEKNESMWKAGPFLFKASQFTEHPNCFITT